MAIEREIYTLTWLIPKRVISLTYNKNEALTADVLRQIGLDVEELIEQGEAPLHFIGNSAGQGDIKANVTAIRDALKVFSDERWGWVMLVGLDRLSNFFASMVGGMLKMRFETVKTEEEALQRLYKLDPTLPRIES